MKRKQYNAFIKNIKINEKPLTEKEVQNLSKLSQLTNQRIIFKEIKIRK